MTTLVAFSPLWAPMNVPRIARAIPNATPTMSTTAAARPASAVVISLEKSNGFGVGHHLPSWKVARLVPRPMAIDQRQRQSRKADRPALSESLERGLGAVRRIGDELHNVDHARSIRPSARSPRIAAA